jgi:phosphoribosyl 1,2-cyclic phosphate phosphodiesterase
MGLDDVRAFCFLQGAPIPIYADAHTMENIRRIFTYVFEANYPAGGIPRLDPHLIDGPFDLWGKSFIPIPVMHGQLPVLGFRVGRAAYVTDFSDIPPSTLLMLEGLDVLVLDALRQKPHPTHSNVEHSLALARRLKPKQTYFTHIAHEMGHGEGSAQLPPGVQLAYDGLKVEF